MHRNPKYIINFLCVLCYAALKYHSTAVERGQGAEGKLQAEEKEGHEERGDNSEILEKWNA